MFPLGACKARMLEASKLRSSPDMGQNGTRIMERSAVAVSHVFSFSLSTIFFSAVTSRACVPTNAKHTLV